MNYVMLLCYIVIVMRIALHAAMDAYRGGDAVLCGACVLMGMLAASIGVFGIQMELQGWGCKKKK